MLNITKTKIFERSGKWHIDCLVENIGRKRVSSGLLSSKENKKLITLEFIEDKIRKSLGLSQTKKQINKKLTFRYVAEMFLESLSVKSSTLRIYKSNINVLHKKIFNNIDLRFLESYSINEKIKENNISNQHISFLNNLISFVNDEFELKLKKIRISRSEFKLKNEVKPFNRDEIKLILANAQGELKEYLKIAFTSGLRQGEILALRPESISLDSFYINSQISQSSKRYTKDF